MSSGNQKAGSGTATASASSSYRSPSDMASPVTQKITAMKTRRINKSNMKARSLFASTVSNQHLKSSTTSTAGGGKRNNVQSPGSQSEGSMADDELDGGASDKSDDTILVRRSSADSSRDRSRQKTAPLLEDKNLDDGYLADESERN